MRFKYTKDALQEVLERDNAVLVSYDGKLSKRTIITFICYCGKESNKIGNEVIRRAGALCKNCAVERGIEKAKATLKIKHNRALICTVESLHDIIYRDNAILLKEYDTITKNCIVSFRCKCGQESQKNCLQLIKVSGAFCEN